MMKRALAVLMVMTFASLTAEAAKKPFSQPHPTSKRSTSKKIRSKRTRSNKARTIKGKGAKGQQRRRR
jgi:hypothetical protein